MKANDMDYEADCRVCTNNDLPDVYDGDCPACSSGRVRRLEGDSVVLDERVDNGYVVRERIDVEKFEQRYGDREGDTTDVDEPDLLDQLSNNPLGTNEAEYGFTLDASPASADLSIGTVVEWMDKRGEAHTAELFRKIKSEKA